MTNQNLNPPDEFWPLAQELNLTHKLKVRSMYRPTKRYLIAFLWALFTILTVALATRLDAPIWLALVSSYISGYWFAQVEQALERKGQL